MDYRSVSYEPELDPRKKIDPIFPSSDVVELINAPARALAADILADKAFSAAVSKVFSGEEADKFAEATFEGISRGTDPVTFETLRGRIDQGA